MYRVYEVVGSKEKWVADIAEERQAIAFVYFILEAHSKEKYLIRDEEGIIVDHDLLPEIQRKLHKLRLS